MEMISQKHVMTQKPLHTELPSFFDKNPELKARIQEYLARLPESEKQKNLDTYRKFVTGDLTWAEIKQVPRSLLKELAKAAYFKFQKGDLKSAETLFKGLSIIDHNNWYYRSALGAILQKQNDYPAAIAEYTTALQINPDEPTSLLNRGECYIKQHDFDAALEDFALLQRLPLAEDNPYKKRARVLAEKILSEKDIDSI